MKVQKDFVCVWAICSFLNEIMDTFDDSVQETVNCIIKLIA